MKITLLTFVTFLVISISGKAQSKSEKMYDVFSNRDGITDISFSKTMIGGIDLDLGDDGEEKQVTGDLHRIRFMSYNPEKGDLSGHEFIKKAVDYLPKSSYKKYKDKDGEVEGAEIWLMGHKKKYKECHVFVKNDNPDGLCFVVSFFGDFKVDDIEGLKEAGKNFSED